MAKRARTAPEETDHERMVQANRTYLKEKGLLDNAVSHNVFDTGNLLREISTACALSRLTVRPGMLLPDNSNWPEPSRQLYRQVIGKPLIPGMQVVICRHMSVSPGILVDFFPDGLVCVVRLDATGQEVFVQDRFIIPCGYDARKWDPAERNLVLNETDFLRPLNDAGTLFILVGCCVLHHERTEISGMHYPESGDKSEELKSNTIVFPGGARNHKGLRTSSNFHALRKANHPLIVNLFRILPSLPALVEQIEVLYDLQILDMHVLDFHGGASNLGFAFHQDLHGDHEGFCILKTLVILLSSAVSRLRIRGLNEEEIEYKVGDIRSGVGIAFPSRLWHSSLAPQESPHHTRIPRERKIVFFFGKKHESNCQYLFGQCSCAH